MRYTINIFNFSLYLKVNPIGEDGNKPVKLAIADGIPIISMDGSMLDEKGQKSSAVSLEKEKEDKNVLSALPVATVKEIEGYENQLGEAEPLPNSYIRFMERSGEELDGKQCLTIFIISLLVCYNKILSFNFITKFIIIFNNNTYIFNTKFIFLSACKNTYIYFYFYFYFLLIITNDTALLLCHFKSNTFIITRDTIYHLDRRSGIRFGRGGYRVALHRE